MVTLFGVVWVADLRRNAAREQRSTNGFKALAAWLGDPAPVNEDGDTTAQGLACGRPFRLARRAEFGRNGHRGETRLWLTTPINGLDRGHSVHFNAAPGWAPAALRGQPFRDQGTPMAQGWFNDDVHSAVKAAMDCGDDVQLSVEGGELRWSITLRRDLANLPTPADLQARLEALAALATRLDSQAGGQPSSAAVPAPLVSHVSQAEADGAPRSRLLPLQAGMVASEALPFLALLTALVLFDLDAVSLVLVLSCELVLINLLSAIAFRGFGVGRLMRDMAGTVIGLGLLLPASLALILLAGGTAPTMDSMTGALASVAVSDTLFASAAFAALHLGALLWSIRGHAEREREWTRLAVAQASTTLLGFLLQLAALGVLVMLVGSLFDKPVDAALGSKASALVVILCRSFVALALVARVPKDAWGEAVTAAKR
ncbi:MAG: hypothetical protein R3F12_15710 [Lysobacteraceae bacterium]